MPLIVKCSKCPFKGVKKQAIDHFLKRHTPLEQIPFFCMLCNFKAINQAKWDKHINTWENHAKAAKACKVVLSHESYCKKGVKSFNLRICEGGDLIPIEKPRNIVVKSNESSEIPENIEIRVQEQENQFKYEEEIENLKATLSKERKEFERYIRKLEDTKSNMKKEIGTLEEKLKEKSKKEQLQNDLRKTEKELENIRKRKHDNPIRLKSEVHLVHMNKFARKY